MDDEALKNLIGKMTLEEKAGMCSGGNWFQTKGVKRLGIPQLSMYDGPNGLRKNAGGIDDDKGGGYKAVESTCFPTGSAMAASWDEDLLYEIGRRMGLECQAEDVPLLLGPAINIKRSPLCGRNFEYLSEDPYLAGKLAAALVRGIQSQGVGACLKHYAANNQEDMRASVNCVIDERTLREIYLRPFEIAVKEAGPETVMCAYNQINGLHCSKNAHILNEILRGEWGFKGFVMTDWGAVKDKAESLAAGLDLEMPYGGSENDELIVEAVKNGIISENTLDETVLRILRVVFRLTGQHKPGARYDKNEHHSFARASAAECMVLLKNEDNALPISCTESIALIGEMAANTRFQGGGSAHVTTGVHEHILGEIKTRSNYIEYAQGYRLDGSDDPSLRGLAVELAARSSAAVVVMGLPESYESEGFDRAEMKLPDNQIKLLHEIYGVSQKVIVVLISGSPVETDWDARAKALLEAYYAGQGAAGAVCGILFGETNPCGRLAETFPEKLEHNPSYLNFGTGAAQVGYHERIYVGYRYYEKKKIAPKYPFGHGLSYTGFEYASLKVNRSEISPGEEVRVSCTVKNTGGAAGKEVVQLYVASLGDKDRPVKELRAFRKVWLAPGDEQTVEFTLDISAFTRYDETLRDFYAPGGGYRIEIGASSADIRLRGDIRVRPSVQAARRVDGDTPLETLAAYPDTLDILNELLGKYLNTKYTGSGGMSLRQAALFSKGAITGAILNEYILKFNHALGTE